MGRSRLRAALALALLAAGLAACGGSRVPIRLDDPARAYRSGEPVFELEALSTVRDDTTGVDVYLSLPRSSLIYRQSAGDFLGVARWAISVEQEGRPPEVVERVDTVRVATAEAGRSAETVLRVERFDVPPGAYRVRAVLEDVGSGRRAGRLVDVDVVPPRGTPSLSSLRLEGRRPTGEVGPLVALGLPAGVDSLQVVAQATAVPDGAVLVATVSRVEIDTTAAIPISAFTPRPYSLVARGANLRDVDTVQTVRQPLADPAGALQVGVPLPSLRPGLYRISLALVTEEGAEPSDESERLVIVRRRDYPLVTRAGDLIEPLVYLADPGEIERLLEPTTVFSQQRAFDRFWGEYIDDRRVAASTVRAYYERVEEANRLFGAQKEGWKTDRGMVYVLFGPPSFVESTIDGETWTYGRGEASPPAFVFERTAGRYGEDTPLSVLTLVRDRAYHDAWLRVRRLWRTGNPP